MKRIIALFAFAAVTVLAQSSPSFGQFQGTAAVGASGHPCSSAQNVGSTYTRIANPSTSYVCQQTGSNALGAGAFAWVTSTNGSGNVTLTGTQTLTNKTLTAPVISTISNSGTVTLPTSTGGVPVAYFCGATSGTTTCANTSGGATARVFGGIATLASNSAVISAISPAFTSTSTYTCVANDLTTRANPVQVANTSSSSITITNTTGASDVINYICVGY